MGCGVVGDCDYGVCGDCDYGVCGDCNDIDLATVAVVCVWIVMPLIW